MHDNADYDKRRPVRLVLRDDELELLEGNCVEVMAAMPDASVDAVVCDPPYNLSFMSRAWDRIDGELIDPAFLHWFAGFVDGEGCFSVHRKVVNGCEVFDCQFSISLRADDRPILERIHRTLGIGTLSSKEAHRKPDASRSGARPQARYSVSSQAHCRRLRDLLRAFPLRAKKARDFEVWSDALDAWIAHEPGESWDDVAVLRRNLMEGRAYTEDGVRVDPFQFWTWRWAREALRVLKPGGHLIAFGGTRTYHRLTAGLEDAGFEIRDCLAWLHGQGFPKSRNIGDGWGTALKPGFEPIVLARAPFKGSVDANHQLHGTGGLNVKATVIAAEGGPGSVNRSSPERYAVEREIEQLGRWPANVVLSHHEACVKRGVKHVASDGHYPAARGPGGLGTAGHAGQGGLAEAHTAGEAVEAWDCHPACSVRQLDEQSGEARSSGLYVRGEAGERTGPASIPLDGLGSPQYADRGGASRFFYCAKASVAEREEGLDGLPRRFAPTMGNGIGEREHDPELDEAYRRNVHPTVKPVDLMRWLVRLVCRRGGLVLDPFMGSGTTGIACLREEVRFVGIEQDAEYMRIALARLKHHQVRNLTLEVE